jgi:predicted transcriptional regulator
MAPKNQGRRHRPAVVSGVRSIQKRLEAVADWHVRIGRAEDAVRWRSLQKHMFGSPKHESFTLETAAINLDREESIAAARLGLIEPANERDCAPLQGAAGAPVGQARPARFRSPRRAGRRRGWSLETEKEVLNALVGGPLPGKNIVSHTSVTYDTLRRVLPAMKRRGLLKHSAEKGYSLTAKGKRRQAKP